MSANEQQYLQGIISKYPFGLMTLPLVIALAKDVHNAAVRKTLDSLPDIVPMDMLKETRDKNLID